MSFSFHLKNFRLFFFVVKFGCQQTLSACLFKQKLFSLTFIFKNISPRYRMLWCQVLICPPGPTFQHFSCSLLSLPLGVCSLTLFIDLELFQSFYLKIFLLPYSLSSFWDSNGSILDNLVFVPDLFDTILCFIFLYFFFLFQFG